MSLKRKEIRAELVAKLTAAITDVSGRVFSSRPDQIDARECPLICVYTLEEGVETLDNEPTIQKRTVSMAVDVLVNGVDGLDDKLDDLCAKVENELLKNQFSPEGLYSGVTLTRTEMGFTPDGKKFIAAARLTFDIDYERTFT